MTVWQRDETTWLERMSKARSQLRRQGVEGPRDPGVCRLPSELRCALTLGCKKLGAETVHAAAWAL
jgi:hypothetical protein